MLSQREQSVCQRLRAFRDFLQIPRSRFAVSIGYGSDRIASYEAGRAPLKYEVFKAVAERYDLNPEWLATGDGSRGLPSPFDDTAFAKAVPPHALFTAVYDGFIAAQFRKLRQDLHNLQRLRTNPPEPLRAEMFDYCIGLDALAKEMRESIERDQKHCAQLEALACRIRMDLRRGSRQAYEAKLQALAAVTRKASGNPAPSTGAAQTAPPKKRKLLVDTHPGPDMIVAVNSETGYWKALVKRVRALTAAPRAKARLARELGITRQAVNKWLSNKGAPSAEITLCLLHWVEEHDGQQNALGSSIKTAKGEATRGRKCNETKPSSSHEH